MPTTSISIRPSVKAEVLCGLCMKTRVAAEHPQATLCECGKTIMSDHPNGEKEG